MERRNTMKKKLLPLVGAILLALTIGACTPKESPTNPDDGGSSEVITKHTITFYVDGERYATKKVEEGQHIPSVANPTKEGYKFVCWLEGETPVDLETYVVTKDARFDASFEIDEGDVLSVDDVKEEGKSYYLVFGWWEVNDPEDPTKVTSSLTKPTVRLFYENMIKYLKLKTPAATETEIANIQFRNYSSKLVSEMGQMINSDGDVDIIIGVGANIKTGGGVDYYDRFQTSMGAGPKERYVVAPTVASDLGKETFEWLRDTDAGKAAFLRELTDAEIEASFIPETIDLAVTVHGDTNITTTLTNKEDVIEMPTITVMEGKQFHGFATTENAKEAELSVAKNATLKYDDVKSLVLENAHTLDLYPVIKDVPVVEEDLIVYIQVYSDKLRMGEAKLLESRFKAAHPNKNIKFNFVEGKSSVFTEAIGTNPVDVIIGGNSPVDSYTKDELGPTATAGAKHFQDPSRKIIISDRVSSNHKTLAKALYDFVIADAPVFNVNVALWQKADKSWVSDAERDALIPAMEAQLKTFLNVAEDATLLDKYNVNYIYDSITTNTDNGKDKVADLVAATQAAFDGAGADLIIGCGGNIYQQTGYENIPYKAIPTIMVAGNRKVALAHDNALSRAIYDNYFPAE